MSHPFILTPGSWEGAGKISFSMADDVLDFKVRWTVLPISEGKIYFNQEVDVRDLPDKMQNHFTLSELSDSAFDIMLENSIVGKVAGNGVISEKLIAWEFRRDVQDFEGFEIYELQSSGAYSMRAEFTSDDDLRTRITGEIHSSTKNT